MVVFVPFGGRTLRPTVVASHPNSGLFQTGAAAAALACVLAVLILLGWASNLEILKSGLPGQRATQPLTAVCFGLAAISRPLKHRALRPVSRFSRGCCAGLVLLLMVATVSQTPWMSAGASTNSCSPTRSSTSSRVSTCARAVLLPGLWSLSGCMCVPVTHWARSAAARSLYVWLATAADTLGRNHAAGLRL